MVGIVHTLHLLQYATTFTAQKKLYYKLITTNYVQLQFVSYNTDLPIIHEWTSGWHYLHCYY